MNGNSNDPQEEVLYFNDEWEEMEKLKLLRWVVYPTKKTYGFFKSRVFSCCSRRDDPSESSRNVNKKNNVIFNLSNDRYLNQFIQRELIIFTIF